VHRSTPKPFCQDSQQAQQPTAAMPRNPGKASEVAKHAKAHKRAVAQMPSRKKPSSRSARSSVSLTSGKKVSRASMLRKGRGRPTEAAGPAYIPKVFKKPASHHLAHQPLNHRISLFDIARVDTLLLFQIFVDLGLLPDLSGVCSKCKFGHMKPVKRGSQGSEIDLAIA
jgi:hypothetical protein